MLSIEKSKRYHGKCTPNVLPCRINHNGPVDASKRYWNPTKTPGKKQKQLFCWRSANDFLQMERQWPISEEGSSMRSN